jgi:hypothetical protein
MCRSKNAGVVDYAEAFDLCIRRIQMIIFFH